MAHRLAPLLIAAGIVAALGLSARAGRIQPAATHEVAIADFGYAPIGLTVAIGDTVQWTNNGPSAHTITSDSALWDSGTISSSLTFTRTFTTFGTFPYHCAIHPEMVGSVAVTLPTLTPSRTATVTRTATNTPTATNTATPRSAYIPIVGNPPTATATPSPTATPTNTPLPTVTPIPPPLSEIVIQPFQVSSSYTIDEFREVKNDEAAKSYLDPKAALKAFQAQARESSWYARYLSSFLNPLGIGSQGIRYLTTAGADAGFDYSVLDERTEFPDYIEFSLSAGERSSALRRGFIENGKAYYLYLFHIRKGRYVAIVRVAGYQADLTYSIAVSYARKAEARLP